MRNLLPKHRRPIGLIQACLCGLFVFVPLTSSAVAKTSSQQVVQHQASTTWRSRLISIFRRKPPLPQSYGGSRGQFCLLSPGATLTQGESALWNQRPNLIWTGRLAKVLVKEEGASEVLWQQSSPGNSTGDALGLKSLRYSGPLLEAGKQYEFQAFASSFDTQAQQILTFSILSAAQRGPITRSWLQEQVALRQRGATTGEQTVEQAEFLLDRELSADFYQAWLLASIRGQLDREEEAFIEKAVQAFCRGESSAL